MPHWLRDEVQACGAELIHVEATGRKNANCLTMIFELALVALDRRPPHGICLISGRDDFAYPLAMLKRRGYTTAVITPKKETSSLLTRVPHYLLSLLDDVLKDIKPAPKKAADDADEDHAPIASSLMSRRLQPSLLARQAQHRAHQQEAHLGYWPHLRYSLFSWTKGLLPAGQQRNCSRRPRCAY